MLVGGIIGFGLLMNHCEKQRLESMVESSSRPSYVSACEEKNLSSKKESSSKEEPDYYSILLKWEGKRNKVYDPIPNDGKYEPTIGIGHYLDRSDSRKTFEKILLEVNYDDIYQGKSELTDEQVKRLFNHDILEYVSTTKKLFPNFDTYPPYVREGLVNGVYRGDLTGSPKTRKLINEGDFDGASIEYLRNKEYQDAVKNGRRGIRSRMEYNAKVMKRYSKELKKGK